MGHLKLHIPGPIEVSDKTFEAFRTPMIGHRSQDFKDLYTAVMPNLQALLYTERWRDPQLSGQARAHLHEGCLLR